MKRDASHIPKRSINRLVRVVQMEATIDDARRVAGGGRGKDIKQLRRLAVAIRKVRMQLVELGGYLEWVRDPIGSVNDENYDTVNDDREHCEVKNIIPTFVELEAAATRASARLPRTKLEKHALATAAIGLLCLHEAHKCERPKLSNSSPAVDVLHVVCARVGLFYSRERLRAALSAAIKRLRCPEEAEYRDTYRWMGEQLSGADFASRTSAKGFIPGRF